MFGKGGWNLWKSRFQNFLVLSSFTCFFFFLSYSMAKILCRNKSLLIICTSLIHIRSNLPVAQNGRFLTKPVYLWGATMVLTRDNILDFRVSKIPKNKLFRTFCSPKLFLESWNLHWLRENFPDYPRDITLVILK